jgi:hypothetical protein
MEIALYLLVTTGLLFCYLVGLQRMGFAGGLLGFIATVVLFLAVWPLAVVVSLCVAFYGLGAVLEPARA